MAGKSTDRRGRAKETKSTMNEPAAFVLPDSLPCSEIEFPLVIRKALKANWKEILEESEEWHREIQAYAESKMEAVPKSPFTHTESEYINMHVLVHLVPALEETLNKAKLWEALVTQKCFFNGIDHIVQHLWNNNPRFPGRKMEKTHLFNMPWIRRYLEKHPRPYYPKSWLWPEEYAATLIQKTVRQYFVQREDDVHEMRDFWKKLNVEKINPEIDTNPFLAKKFASEPNFTNKHS